MAPISGCERLAPGRPHGRWSRSGAQLDLFGRAVYVLKELRATLEAEQNSSHRDQRRGHSARQAGYRPRRCAPGVAVVAWSPQGTLVTATRKGRAAARGRNGVQGVHGRDWARRSRGRSRRRSRHGRD